jgi:hypothetical protein
MNTKLSSLLISTPLVGLSTTAVISQTERNLAINAETIHSGQQYDIATFT